MKWINCFEKMPEIDRYADDPMHYIVRCKVDGGRGFNDAFYVTAEQMRDIIKEFDVCQWLDENPDFELTNTMFSFMISQLKESGVMEKEKADAIIAILNHQNG